MLLQMGHSSAGCPRPNPLLDQLVENMAMLPTTEDGGKTGVICQLCFAKCNSEFLPVRVIDGADRHISVGCLIDVEWGTTDMCIRLSLRGISSSKELNQFRKQKKRTIL